MKLSKRQEDIAKTFREKDCNLVIKAGPGSGKSTTLLYLASQIEFGKQTLMIAFNNGIVADLNEKIGNKGLFGVQAKTLHSLGLGLLRDNGVKYRLVKDKKFYDLFNSLDTSETEYYKGLARKEQLKIMFAIKDLDNFSRLFLSNDLGIIRAALLESGNIPVQSQIIDALWKSFIEARESGYNKDIINIDFTDMLYLPVRLKLSCRDSYNYIFADEAQDFSKLHHKLLRIFIGNTNFEKFVAVGDSRQSINSFAGALSDSMDLFNNYENTVELPLDETFRCPSAICQILWDIYPGLKTRKKGGNVTTVDEEDLSTIKPNSMILCRNTAPLIKVMLKLGALNKNCHIKGDDPLASCRSVFKDYLWKSPSEAINLVQIQLNLLSTRMNNDSSRIEFYIKTDGLEAMKYLVEGLQLGYRSKVKDYLDKAKSLFTPKPNNIILSTIHKSKGLESKDVYLINKKEFMPSKMAKGDSAMIQETNLLWVAVSRAQENFYYLNIKLKEDK